MHMKKVRKRAESNKQQKTQSHKIIFFARREEIENDLGWGNN